MRVDGQQTVQLNASEREVPDTFVPARYQDASVDGTKVFFTTGEVLTDDTGPAATKLYMYDAESVHDETQRVTVSATEGTFTLTFDGQTTADIPYNATAGEVDDALSTALDVNGGTLLVSGGPGDATGSNPYEVTFRGPYAATDQPLMSATDGATPLSGGTGVTVAPWTRGGGHLTFLSADNEPADGNGGDTQAVIGTSEDGSNVYFIAGGQLEAGESQLTGDPGIYLWRGGEIAYIGRSPVGTAQFELWSSAAQKQARVSADGRHLVFTTTDGRGLLSEYGGTDYDHTGCTTGAIGGCRGVYVYSADRDKLSCASCRPSGAPATMHAGTYVRALIGGSKMTWTQSNALSEDGRYVFFTTGESLVAEDLNGPCVDDPLTVMAATKCADAYVFDALSEEVSLLSTGQSTSASYFVDASDDGRDVFIATNERLSGWDVDGNYDVYDARIDGGFAEPDPEPVGCEEDGCQDPVSNTGLGSQLNRSSLNGPGDPPIAGRPDLERCNTLANKARKASKRAKSLRERASKTGGRRAVRLRRQARKASRSARRASSAATRCRAQAARASTGQGGGR